MRRILSERNLVVILFVMAFVVFVFAQEETKKIEKQYKGQETVASPELVPQPVKVSHTNAEKKPGASLILR
jgi:hypothetical protein